MSNRSSPGALIGDAASRNQQSTQIKSSQMLVFEKGNGSTRRKPLGAELRTNKLNTHNYDTGSENRTRGTLVGGECSHHCTIPASPTAQSLHPQSIIFIHYSSTRILQDTNDYFLSELTLSFCCSSRSPSTSLCNAFTCFSRFSTSSLRFLVSIVL